MGETNCNIDGEEVSTLLALSEYDGVTKYAWILLEKTPAAE